MRGSGPVAPDLVAVAASLHIAPAPRVIFGGVEEEPTARVAGAFGKAAELSNRQQLAGVAGHRPQRSIERVGRIPAPGIVPAVAFKPGMGERRADSAVD